MNICQEKIGEYLDTIENGLGATAVERSRKLDELTSIDELAVENIVSAYGTASNQAAYLRALAMALVRAGRNQQCAHLANV